MNRPIALLMTLCVCGISTGAAQADMKGPTYPLPGTQGTGHGGDSCRSSGAGPGSGGAVWVFGGADGSANSGESSASCVAGDTTVTPPVPFDTGRFQTAYWGFSNLAWDATGRCTGASIAYDSADSHPDTGLVVMSDGTGCKLTVRVQTTGSSPADVPLADATTAGVTGSAMPYVVAITPSLTSFKVSFVITDAANGPLNQSNCVPFGTCTSHTDLQGSFWYTSRPPTGDFTYPTPANHQALTLTAGTLADPDGTIDHFSWDLDGDGTYGDSANSSSAQTAALGPGDHVVGLEIVDDDGTVTDVTHHIVITNQAPAADFACTPNAPAPGAVVTCTATDSDPDAAPGDPALAETWDFAGTPATGHQASGALAAGAHTVTLHVADRDGATTTVSHTITVAAAGAGGGGSGADLTPPTVTLKVPKQKLKKLLKSGLLGTITANEAATAKLQLVLSKALAKKLKLKGVLGSAAPRLTGAGSVSFKIKLNKKAVRKLKKLKKVAFVLTVSATDTAGNRAALKKSLSFKR